MGSNPNWNIEKERADFHRRSYILTYPGSISCKIIRYNLIRILRITRPSVTKYYIILTVEELQETYFISSFFCCCINLCFCYSVATFDYLLSFNKIAYFHPFRRGFFCQNQDLMYPYREVSVKGGYVALISLLPLIMIVGVSFKC